jgi:HemY protein
MRKIVLASVLALVVGAGLWHVLQYDSGYILIVVAGKTIEMRLAFALLGLLLLILLVRGVWRMLTGILGAVSGGWQAVAGRKALRTELRTQRGLLSYFEGDWLAAQRDLLRAARKLPRPLVHYVAAAQSVQQLGQPEKAEELLAKAELIAAGDKLVVVLSHARLLLQRRQYEASLSKLHQAKTMAPHHPAVLDLLHRVYLALGDWVSLELLLPELRRYKALSEADLVALKQKVHVGSLNQVGKELRKQPSDPAALGRLQEVWQHLPKAARLQAEYAGPYAQLLLLIEQHDQTENLLRHALNEAWSSPLVELYGLAAPADRQGQLHQAQRWLLAHEDDAELHLALGRICLRNEIWGQARDHFQRSLALKPTPAVYAELGRLAAHLSEPHQSHEYFQQGLLLVTNGLPSLPMPR